MKFLLLFLILVGCTTEPVKVPEDPKQPVEEPQTTKVWKTPTYQTTKGLDENYKAALKLISAFANSDEFISFVARKRTYFKHTTNTVPEALAVWRKCLNDAGIITLDFYTPWLPSRAIGGWDGSKINENTKYNLSVIERAGHLVHETAHKCGFTHLGNYTNQNDNVNSFPYAIGYDFEDFTATKTTKLAGSK